MSTAPDTPQTHLSPAQHARVEALQKARAVLVARSPLGPTGTAKPYDLHALANYVLDGRDPWALVDGITCSRTTLAAAFDEWQRRYDTDPTSFDVVTAGSGENCATYLIELVDEIETTEGSTS